MILSGSQMPIMVPPVKSSLPAGTTWNPSDKASEIILSNGNLTATKSGTSHRGVRSTASFASGKQYWEVRVNQLSSGVFIGIGQSATSLTVNLGGSGSFAYQQNGAVRYSGSIVDNVSTYDAGDIVGIAVDATAQLIFIAKNGVWQASSNPSTGVGGYAIGNTTWFPMVSLHGDGDAITANFNGPFAYTPPTGFTG